MCLLKLKKLTKNRRVSPPKKRKVDWSEDRFIEKLKAVIRQEMKNVLASEKKQMNFF